MLTAIQPKRWMTKPEAWAIVGGLSSPSKMPGYAYGLPAKECGTGGALRKVPGSVCSGCYAFKGNYMFPNVQKAQYRRLESLGHPRWVEAMVFLVTALDMRYFRWHDSGDLQSPAHLNMIVQVARQCPDVQFWLPTRERIFVYSWTKANGELPKNLVVRVSAAMIDGPAPEFPNTSTVVTGQASCPAPSQGGECGTCRACWNPEVKNVSYRKH